MQFTNILCPVDFSDVSRQSLAKAVELAQKDQARIIVVHVVANKPWLVPPVPTMPVDMGKYQEQLLDSARTALDEMVHEIVPDKVPSNQVLDTGNPGEVIVKVAKENGVDLIVMASREEGTWSHFLFGSVAEKVIRGATCPVLVLKQEQ